MSERLNISEEEKRFEHSASSIVLEIEDIQRFFSDIEDYSEHQIRPEDFVVVKNAGSSQELHDVTLNKIEGFASLSKHASEISEGLESLDQSFERPKYLRFFTSEDKDSGRKITMLEFNKDSDMHTSMAYAGARKSRSAEDFIDIFVEIFGKDAGKRLSSIFVGYGHASVADMSPLMLYIDGLNMNEAFTIFNYTALGGGQELSTRYVEFGEQNLRSLSELGVEADAELEQKWQKLKDTQIDNYQKWLGKLKSPIDNFIGSHNHGKSDRIVQGSVDTRSLDAARYWLPLGSKTGMCYLTSTRNWIDIARQLYQSERDSNRDLADHIIDVLKFSDDEDFADIQAHLSGLTKYYEGTNTISSNLSRVEHLTQDSELPDLNVDTTSKINRAQSNVEVMWPNQDKLSSIATLTQYLSLVYPNVQPNTLRQYLNESDDDFIATLGEAVFADHTQHDQMARAGDVRGVPAVVDTAIGLQRDLNRHRGLGRLQVHLDALSALDSLNLGFNHNYAIQNAEYWQQYESEWLKDFENFYEQMYEVIDELEARGNDPAYTANALLEVMPLAHQTRAIYSGPANQLAYMTSLRVAVGGDYGYRDVVWQWLEALREDPGYRKMSSHLEQPDINNIEQLLGRS